MMISRAIRICLLSALAIKTITNAEKYEYSLLASAHIASQLEEFPQKYPQLATLTTAQEAFNLPHAGSKNDCTFYSQEAGCPNYILTIQDSIAHPPGSPSSKSLPEVFLSGALHGNERVGPTAVLETVKLLLKAAQCESLPQYRAPPNLDTEEGADWLLQAQEGVSCRNALLADGITDSQRLWLARLVSTRRIVAVPMTNALGYDRNQRAEDGIDPNRDFPYDVQHNDPSKCMQTIAARTVNELYQRHLFQMSLTYHAGTEVVGYEWGAFPYLDTNISPDDYAQVDIGSAYARYAGKFEGTPQYKSGTMNELVYAVHGGMEDWAYAGSWDVDKVIQCNPTTYGGYDAKNTVYNQSTLRTFNMLIETSNAKVPTSHLGNNQGLLNALTYENNGHVARNIRLALTAIEFVQPYVSIRGVNNIGLQNDIVPLIEREGRSCIDGKIMRIPPGQKNTVIAWTVGGGLNVDYTNIMYSKWDDVPDKMGCIHQPSQSDLGKSFRTTEAMSGPTRWKEGWQDGDLPATQTGDQEEPMYYATIDTSSFQPGDKIAVYATAQLDQGWENIEDDAKPMTSSPMSHVVNARTNLEWFHESNGKVIQGRKDWYSIPLTLIIGEESGDGSADTIDLSDRFAAPHVDDGIDDTIEPTEDDEGEEDEDGGSSGETSNEFSAGRTVPKPNIFLITALSVIAVYMIFRHSTRRSQGHEKLRALDDEFEYTFDQEEDIQLRELS